MAEETIFEQDGPVAFLTFNRPEARNAMTWGMYEALRETAERVDEDPGTRVLVLRGAGDKAFVGGTDIRQFLEFKTREDALGYESRLDRSIGRLARMQKPVIAMIQGDAVGGGLFMALACDIRIAAEHTRYGVPVARTLGNFPAPANYARLVAAIGPIRARNLLLTARLMNAEEAHVVGLVDEVVPPDQLEGRVRELAGRMAGHAPLTMSALKEATRRLEEGSRIRDAEELVLSCYLSQDFQEGVRAFLEKRTPNWQGR
ncbi:MAG: enoyl-CoA hydratase/isomerase family protein [Actinobacteria bacterium]|nr:enoyl-CoA hydratase/isomerase family protein [Actinomycetota bacterium]